MSALIDLRSVSRIYRRSQSRVNAVDGVSLSVEQGEYLSVLGESGSGKSTLMNIIGCLDKPDGGEYLFCGKNTAKMTERELDRLRLHSIGFVFQRFCLISALSAFDNVELPLIYARVPRAQRIRRVKEALETVGLSDRGDHRPNELSGGQQQRVAVARAIVKDPPLILADEPTGNLDPKTACEIAELFSMLNRAGKTIVLITHDRSVAERAERSVVINGGKIVG